MRPATIPIGMGSRGPVAISGAYANRHALVTGATGTGKTYTLATMAEGFSRAGVPSIVVDVKGDLSGIVRGSPGGVVDPFGHDGRPARLDVSRMGPDLLTRALELSEAQSGALDVAFEVARLYDLRLSDLADLRDVLALLIRESVTISEAIGLVTRSSVSAVQRAALRLERDAADAFGSPALDVADLLQGNGQITVLAAARLIRTPGLYGALCAHILAEIFERFPEVGDRDRPRLAVFLDESHLIFDGAPPALTRRVESIVRLIRSRGVALVFVTQSPADLPPGIAGQLQNRIQHGLRGVTANDLRAIRAAADTLPRSPGLDVFRAIEGLGVGQALVSVVGPGGVPSPVDVVRVDAPAARLAPLSEAERLAQGPAPKPPRVQVIAAPEPEPEAPPPSSARIALRRLLIGIPIVLAFWAVAAMLRIATG